ncbi:MAG: ABC transporter substrate-binding protein, partial [Nakamurella sp.]
MRHRMAFAAIAAAGLLLAACSSGSTNSASSTGAGAPSVAPSSSPATGGGSTGTAGTPATGSSSATTGSGQPAAAYKKGGSVTIANVAGQTWACQFNPFSPAYYQESMGFVYEPLVYVNLLKNQQETPMLASSYKWSADHTSIVFAIRQSVKWSDGQPLTAKDVAFTFNLMKKVPGIDLYSLWTGAGLKSVVAAGNNVTMTFANPATAYFFNFANQVGIVPEHIWSTAAVDAHPDTYQDTNPVGTGPFMVNPCSANNIQYTANPQYWQPGKPYIQKVQYPAYL